MGKRGKKLTDPEAIDPDERYSLKVPGFIVRRVLAESVRRSDRPAWPILLFQLLSERLDEVERTRPPGGTDRE